MTEPRPEVEFEVERAIWNPEMDASTVAPHLRAAWAIATPEQRQALIEVFQKLANVMLEILRDHGVSTTLEDML